MGNRPGTASCRDGFQFCPGGAAVQLADPAAFESAAAAIHVVSPEGLIVEVNRAFEMLYGASRRLYLGKHHAILGAAPVAAGLRQLHEIRAGILRLGHWRGTQHNERFSGDTMRTRTLVYPMRTAQRGYLVFFQEPVRAAAGARAPARSLRLELAAAR
jgi:PAS domain S-box-containing protein